VVPQPATHPHRHAMNSTPHTRSGTSGWLVFAALMLIIAGSMDVLNGLWALDAQDSAIDAVFWNNNIEAWGWFYIVVGALIIAAGFGVLTRQPWALMVGVITGCFGAVLNMFWIFEYPIVSLVLVLVNILVVYALTTYGTDTYGDSY
jgi:hypothetical protein